MSEDLSISILIGKTIKKIYRHSNPDEIIFCISDLEYYQMYHYQNCCETVTIEDICGENEIKMD